MRLVAANIQTQLFKLDEGRSLQMALGVQGMTVTEVKGFAQQQGPTEIYRGTEHALSFVPKVGIDLVASEQADKVIAAIQDTARTGQGRWQDPCFAHRASRPHSHWRGRQSGCANLHRHLLRRGGRQWKPGHTRAKDSCHSGLLSWGRRL